MCWHNPLCIKLKCLLHQSTLQSISTVELQVLIFCLIIRAAVSEWLYKIKAHLFLKKLNKKPKNLCPCKKHQIHWTANKCDWWVNTIIQCEFLFCVLHPGVASSRQHGDAFLSNKEITSQGLTYILNASLFFLPCDAFMVQVSNVHSLNFSILLAPQKRSEHKWCNDF